MIWFLWTTACTPRIRGDGRGIGPRSQLKLVVRNGGYDRDECVHVPGSTSSRHPENPGI